MKPNTLMKSAIEGGKDKMSPKKKLSNFSDLHEEEKKEKKRVIMSGERIEEDPQFSAEQVYNSVRINIQKKKPYKSLSASRTGGNFIERSDQRSDLKRYSSS